MTPLHEVAAAECSHSHMHTPLQMAESELKMEADPFPCWALALAVADMRAGEEALVTVHDPAFAFGAAGVPGAVPANAVVTYHVTLHDFTDGPASYEVSARERVELANKLKARGNTFFKAGALRRARALYEKANDYAGFEDNGASGDAGDESEGAGTGDEVARVGDVKASIALNLAAVALREGRSKEALVQCNKVRRRLCIALTSAGLGVQAAQQRLPEQRTQG